MSPQSRKLLGLVSIPNAANRWRVTLPSEGGLLKAPGVKGGTQLAWGGLGCLWCQGCLEHSEDGAGGKSTWEGGTVFAKKGPNAPEVMSAELHTAHCPEWHRPRAWNSLGFKWSHNWVLALGLERRVLLGPKAGFLGPNWAEESAQIDHLLVQLFHFTCEYCAAQTLSFLILLWPPPVYWNSKEFTLNICLYQFGVSFTLSTKI